MSEEPNYSTARMKESAWQARREDAQARTWVYSAAETTWGDARSAIREATAAVNQVEGGPRPEVHLHEAEHWVTATRQWRDHLLNPPADAAQEAPLAAIALFLQTVDGENAVEAAQQAVRVAEAAMTWARERTGIEATA